jgi:hypothetical protein
MQVCMVHMPQRAGRASQPRQALSDIPGTTQRNAPGQARPCACPFCASFCSWWWCSLPKQAVGPTGLLLLPLRHSLTTTSGRRAEAGAGQCPHPPSPPSPSTHPHPPTRDNSIASLAARLAVAVRWRPAIADLSVSSAKGPAVGPPPCIGMDMPVGTTTQRGSGGGVGGRDVTEPQVHRATGSTNNNKNNTGST